MTPGKVIESLEKVDRATTAALSIADRLLGAVGKRSARWHRWRVFRLRLRAAEIEAGARRPWLDARERVVVAGRLRKRAAEHMQHFEALKGVVEDGLVPLAEDLRALLDGREPLAGQA